MKKVDPLVINSKVFKGFGKPTKYAERKKENITVRVISAKDLNRVKN